MRLKWIIRWLEKAGYCVTAPDKAEKPEREPGKNPQERDFLLPADIMDEWMNGYKGDWK